MPTATLARPDPAPALAELRPLLGDRLSTAAAVREQHGKDLTYHAGHPPDAVAFAALDRRGGGDRPHLRRAPAAGHRLRHRHLARGPHRRARGRRHHRPLRPRPHPRGQRRGPRRPRRGRRHPQARSTSTCATPACSSRSTPAPTPRSAAWPRPAPAAPTPCATAPCARTCSASPSSPPTARIVRTGGRARKSVGRLRPHPALRRLRGHARHHHRGRSSASTASPRRSPPRSARSRPRRRRRLRHRHHPVRRPGRPRRAARRAADAGDQRLLEARLPRGADALLRVPRLDRLGRGAGADRRRARRGLRRRRLPVDDAGAEERNRLWAPATTSSGRRRRCAPAPRPGRPTSACRSRGSPTPSSPPATTRPPHGLVAPIVGHVGDGNFHMTFLLDPNDPDELAARRRRSTPAWSSGRSRWAAPAPASTASAPARCATSRPSTATRVDADAHDQARPRPARHPQPGQGRPPRPRHALPRPLGKGRSDRPLP